MFLLAIIVRISLRILLSLLFLAFAYLQLNDPDPIRWVVAYTLPIPFFLCKKLTRYRRIAIPFYLFFAWVCLPNELYFWGEMNSVFPAIEETKETLGLLLTAFCLFLSRFLFPSLSIATTVE